MDDLYDEWAGFPTQDVSYGIPIEFDWGNVDFGGWDFSNFDLNKLKNFGFDLSNLANPNFDISDLLNWGADVGFDFSDLSGLDLSGISLDQPYVDLGDTGTLLSDLSDFGLSKQDLSEISLDQPYVDLEDTGTLLNDQTGISGIEGFYDAMDEVGQGTTGITGIAGFGEAADEVGGAGAGTYVPQRDPYEVDEQTSRDETTALIGAGTEDEEALKDKFWKEQVGGSGIAGGISAVPGKATLERVVYDDGSEQIIKKYDDGTEEVISTTDTEGKTTYPGETVRPTPVTPTTPIFSKPTIPTTQKDTTPDWLKSILGKLTPSKDNAMLMALLGGLMGLLSKGSTPKGPTGYQGVIPKYTATRVPGRGVQYTRAAQGGLMALSGGGQPARYLRGGTDGMADKIQTNIDGKQPARLSSGEFVIPADIVGALGSGNSEAGAEVLYDMMDRVRKHAYGHTKQIKQANPKKVLPA